jgi:hypothetical protein
METKEIAMSKRTTMMGTGCALAMAALAAGPAAADTLTGLNLAAQAGFQSDDNSAASDTVKSGIVGGSIAGPITEVSNLNFEADASYSTSWADHYSAIDWVFSGSVFWANMDGRIGVNLNYETLTGAGHVTSGGLFGEWYFGSITAMGKAGFSNSGGNSPITNGGTGNYMGAAVVGYLTPDLAITGAVDWQDLVITGNPYQVVGRYDNGLTAWQINAEYLFDEDYGFTGYAGFVHNTFRLGGVSTDDNVWQIGLRWYTGAPESLMTSARTGTLHWWLTGR